MFSKTVYTAIWGFQAKLIIAVRTFVIKSGFKFFTVRSTGDVAWLAGTRQRICKQLLPLLNSQGRKLLWHISISSLKWRASHKIITNNEALFLECGQGRITVWSNWAHVLHGPRSPGALPGAHKRHDRTKERPKVWRGYGAHGHHISGPASRNCVQQSALDSSTDVELADSVVTDDHEESSGSFLSSTRDRLVEISNI